MRNVVWIFAIVGVAFVALQAAMYSAERKTSVELMNITEMQTAAYKTIPTMVIKDPF